MHLAPLRPLEPAARRRLFDGLSGAVLLTAACAVLFTFADYGMSWDEPYAVVYGRSALAFFSSLGADRSATLGPVTLTLRGPLFQLLVEAVAQLAPEHALLVRRLLTPLIGLLGVAGTWRLARLLGGPALGLIAAALLLLTPIYYGHMFINPADLPFAVAYVWGLYFGARLLTELPHVRRGTVLGAGLALGLGTSMRIGGSVLLGYGLALLAVRALATARQSGRAGAQQLLAAALRPLLALLAIGYASMLALWPAALVHPLSLPWAAAHQAVAYPKHEPVLLAGSVYWSDALPWFYQLGYLLAQLPEQVSIAAAIGSAALTRSAYRAFRADQAPSYVPAGALLLGAFVPLVCACVLRPVDYDGMRHILFVVPPLICLAAAGIAWTFARLASRPLACAVLVGLLVASSARTLATMVELHPYEYVYYNPSVGGTRGARGRFELDYWVTSFREALHALDARLSRERAHEPERNAAALRPYRLAVCGHAAVAYMYLPPTVILTRDVGDADFVLATTKWQCDQRYRGEVVARVERMGVPFAVVKRLQPALARAAR